MLGQSICGGSAIACNSTSYQKQKKKNVAKSISVIFLFNILAALIFPTLGDMLGLTNHGLLLFAELLTDTSPSVTATAAAWDAIHHSNTLDGATIVKLTRTLAIIPISACFIILHSLQESKMAELLGKEHSASKSISNVCVCISS